MVSPTGHANMTSTVWLRELGQMLDDFSEVFGSRLSDRCTELYVEALADLTVEQLRAAADNVLRNHQRYFPTPAEIRAAVPQLVALYLEAPEHQPFPDTPRREPPSPEAIADVVGKCTAIRRILAGGGEND